jgi:hypothetical protein
MAKQVAAETFSELRGLRPWTEGEARRVLASWEASGRTVSEFARGAELNAQRIYGWRRRLGARAAEASSSLVPVVVRGTLSASALGATVWSRAGHRVDVAALDGASAAWAAAVVRALEGERS